MCLDCLSANKYLYCFFVCMYEIEGGKGEEERCSGGGDRDREEVVVEKRFLRWWKMR